jgi:hypothetical protein
MHRQVAAASRVYEQKVTAAKKVFDHKKAEAKKERDAAIKAAHNAAGQQEFSRLHTWRRSPKDKEKRKRPASAGQENRKSR